MYTAKILNIETGAGQSVTEMKVVFTSLGEDTMEKDFTYDGYQFETPADIMNMLKAECDVLNEKELRLAAITALVGVEDIVASISKTIEEEKTIV